MNNFNAMPQYDKEMEARRAVAKDHGADTFGVPGWRVEMHSGHYEERTDREVVANEHGAMSMGVYADKKETWGTDNQEQIDLMRKTMYAQWMKDPGAVVDNLPDESITKIIEQRLKNTANQADTDRSYIAYNQERQHDFGLNLDFDLALIGSMIRKDRLTDNAKFETSLYMGSSDERDLAGVLTVYEDMINKIGVDVPLVDGESGEVRKNENGEPCGALEVITRMKEAIKDSKEASAENNSGSGGFADLEKMPSFEEHMAALERESGSQG